MSVTTECINNVINRQAVLSNIPSAINDAFELDETENSDYSDEIENSENLDENNVVEFNVAGAIPGKCEVIPENSALNIENCSDVIIGPVTQFHGPVTINYQDPKEKKCIENLNGKFHVVEDGLPNGNIKKNGPAKQCSETERRNTLEKLFNKHKKFKILGTASFIVSLGTGLVYYAVVLSIFDHSLDFSTIPGRGKHYMIPREGWDGKPPLKGTKPLSHPVPLVIIIHSATSKCESYEECKLKVASMQAQHVSKLHEPDIGYNFLIGGDGNIYEGRGWDIQNYSRNDSISITFIGNFIYDKLTSEMIDAAKNLITEGVRLEKISKDYLLVCHNQTKNTLSPGENVYREVQKWSHFKPVIII